MDIVEAIVKVLAVGLVLGAGLPALFALGMRAEAAGGGGQQDGATTAPNQVLKFVGYAVFAFVAAVIVVGILWIARQTLEFHFGWQIFPDWAYKKK